MIESRDNWIEGFSYDRVEVEGAGVLQYSWAGLRNMGD